MSVRTNLSQRMNGYRRNLGGRRKKMRLRWWIF
jgi:hypothetical protein